MTTYTKEELLRDWSAALDRATAPIAAVHRDRRERIATAAMQGLLAKYGMGVHDDEMLDEAVEYADRLIARLDKEVKP